ncbi:MAG: hypothetical protein HY810_09230 [Candidatus Omnitrophica bacterium]|nr:hypothetical protein [Candidatus Omnitrophota bacterium]
MSQAHLAQAEGRVLPHFAGQAPLQKYSVDLLVALFFSEKISAERKILRLLYATNSYVVFITLFTNDPVFSPSPMHKLSAQSNMLIKKG